MKLTRLAGVLALACSVSVAAAGLKVGLKEIADGLTAPTILIPYGKNQMLLGEQTGRMSLVNVKNGKLKEFGDIKSIMCKINAGFDERGLIGVALHPEFRQNKQLYIYYSGPLREGGPENWDHTSHVSEFKVNKNKLDLKSERLLLQIDQPYFNHDGGRIAFGPDGMLYIASGDGGHKNDINKPATRDRKTKKLIPAIKARGPKGNSQDLSNLLGKILRIDVNQKSGGKEYGIPKDNPFVGQKGAAPEIWAYGIRNPWSLTFDTSGSGELFVGDVGQSRWEEVNIIKRGGNYGWNLREGNEWFNPKAERSPLDAPYTGEKPGQYEAPIIAYENLGGFGPDQGKGKSITGGYVYRGKAIPALAGKYVFGDWGRRIGPKLGILYVGSKGKDGWSYEALGLDESGDTNLKAFLWAFGTDAAGELYVLTNPGSTVPSNGKGMIQKIVPLN